MSFLGGFLTPPPSASKHLPTERTTTSAASARTNNNNNTTTNSNTVVTTGATATENKSTTSIYNAFSGVKSIVSSYSATTKGRKSGSHIPTSSGSTMTTANATGGHSSSSSSSSSLSHVKSRQERELEAAMHRFRLQSPENHLGMVMAFSDKSLSPFLHEAFCFTWHRLRGTEAAAAGEGGGEGGEERYLDLEDLDIYNAISQNTHSWYPPTADDLGSVMVLHCEDTLGLGLSRQLYSAPLRPEEAFQHRVESVVRQNKIIERVVISSCTHHSVSHTRHRQHYSHRNNNNHNNSHDTGDHNLSNRDQSRVSTVSHPKKHENTSVAGGTHEEEDDDDDDDDDGSSFDGEDSNNESDSEGSSVNINIDLPEFEVGGSIAVNSEGILLREKGCDDCGLHIDCTNFMTLTCVHPSSFIIELPLYHASSSSSSSQYSDSHLHSNGHNNPPSSSSSSEIDPLAPLASIRDLSSVSTLRPSVEWLGEGEGAMYDSLEAVVNPDPEENPLERTLGGLGLEQEQEQQELLFSSLCLQVACRDRATRDLLVLAIRSLAGHVPPSSSSSSSTHHDHDLNHHQEGEQQEEAGGETGVRERERERKSDRQADLQQRLALLPWHSSSHTPSNTHTLSHPAITTTNSVNPPAADKTMTDHLTAEVSQQQKRIQELEGLLKEMVSQADDKALQAAQQQQTQREEEEEVRERETEKERQLAAMQAHLAEEVAAREVLEMNCNALSSDLLTSASQVESLQQEVLSLTEEKDSILSESATMQSVQAEQIEELAGLVKELESAREGAAVALEAMQEEKTGLRVSLEELQQKLLQKTEIETETQTQGKSPTQTQSQGQGDKQTDVEAQDHVISSRISSPTSTNTSSSTSTSTSSSIDNNSCNGNETEDLEVLRQQCASYLSRLHDSEAVVEDLRHQLSLSLDGNTHTITSESSSSSSSGVSDSLHNSTDADADADTDSDRGVASSIATTTSSVSVSVVTVYPMTELKNLIEQFNMSGGSETSERGRGGEGGEGGEEENSTSSSSSSSDACNGDGDGGSQDDFLSLVAVLQAHLSSLTVQISDTNDKLEMSDVASLQTKAQHQEFLKSLEDQVQQISDEMMEKTEAHRQHSAASVATIDGLNESIHVLQNKIQKLDESKRLVEEKVVTLQQEVNTVQGTCDTLRKNALREQEEEEEHERNEQSELQTEVDKLTEECSKWHEECLRLKDMMKSMQKAIKQKEEVAVKVKSDFDILSVRLQEVKQHNELLTAQVTKEKRSLKEQTDQFTYEKSQAANAVKVLEARILNLQSETLTLSDERQVLKRQKSAFDSSKSQIAQLRGQLMESDQTAQATRALLDETTAQLDRLKKEHTDTTIELGNVNDLLTQKTSRIEDLKDRLQVMDNEITSSDKVKSSFRKENARLKDAAKKLKEDSDTVKKLTPIYNQQLSKIADGQSRIVDLESALSDITIVRNHYALTVSALEMRTGVLEKALRRRELHSEREGMTGEDMLTTSTVLLEKTFRYKTIISRLESELSEAKMAEPFELKKLNFMVCKLGGEKNHYENKAKSLSKDLQRKLLAGTPLQRELGKMTARLEEVENERNAYRDAMVLACETYSTKDVSSWFG